MVYAHCHVETSLKIAVTCSLYIVHCDVVCAHCHVITSLYTLSRYNKSVETVTLCAINDFILLCETPNTLLKRKLSVDHVGVLFDAMLYFVNVQVFPNGVSTNMHYLQILGSVC